MGFRSVAKNSFYLIVSQVIAKAFSMISLIWLARYISIDEYGLFNYALSFWAIVMLFVEGGMGALTVREVARDHSLSSLYLSTTFLFKFGISAFTFPFVIFILWALGAIDDSLKIWVFVFVGGGQYLMQIVFSTFIVFFRAHEAFKFEAILSIVAAMINTALVVGAILIHVSFQDIILIMFVANVLVSLIGLLTYWNKIEQLKWKISKHFLLSFGYATIPFLITFIVGGIALKIPVPLLEKFSGTSAVAIYSASMRIVEGFMFIPGAFVTILYPLFSRSFKEGVSHSAGRLDIIFKLLLMTGIPIVLYSFFFKTEIIRLLYGTKYIETAAIWPIWVMWFFIWSAKSVFALFVLAIDKQKAVLVINLTGFLITVALCVVLIPRHSFIGATFAMIIAETIMFTFVSYYIAKLRYRIFDFRKISWIVLVNLILTAFTILTKMNDPIVVPAVFLCFYVAAIFLFRIITPNEKEKLFSVFRRLPNL